jgi:glucans biosynthesis protein
MRRRDLIKAAALAVAQVPLRRAWAQAPSLSGRIFDYDAVKEHAKALAAAPYRVPARELPGELRNLGWDRYQAIRFRPPYALWANAPARFRIEFFHLGLYYATPVRLYEVDAGEAREIAYDPAMFDFSGSGVTASQLPRNLGFAGFRLFYQTDFQRDLTAFLGASYFRAVGGEMQYGQSARGLAVDCGLARPEEFPLFTHFWFERPTPDAERLRIYALMQSASLTGAYRFDIYPGATLVMETECALYPRAGIERLGVAPLTSMFLYGENDRRMANDWRPEIHDTDGLALWTGSGEWLWRPLVNPSALRTSIFQDQNPGGFGLLQRDRNFDHYQDDGAFYERRPSVWIEPTSVWGAGSVVLVELPASDETADNIVAFWNPQNQPASGDELRFSYRLHWGSGMPAASALARVAATRTGIGGVLGRPREYFSQRFIVDFEGANLAMLGADAKVEPDITVSRGRVELAAVRPIVGTHAYRASFDLRPADAGPAPVELRLVLRYASRPITETWLYQWTPPSSV